MTTYICLIVIGILAITAAVFYRRSRYWRRMSDEYMNFYTQAKDERRDIADDLRRKGLECSDLKRDVKKLEKENKKLLNTVKCFRKGGTNALNT